MAEKQKQKSSAPPVPPASIRPPPPPVVVARTSLTYYYLAMSGILLGVILLILYAVCFRQSMLYWTIASFAFGMAFGVIAVYQVISEEWERLFIKLSQNAPPPPPPPSSMPFRQPVPVVIQDVGGDEDEGEY